MENKMKYYNSGSLGVIGCYPKHSDGEYTFLAVGKYPWIRTVDLYNSRKEAENAPTAKFLFKDK